jgi:peptidoglycan/xylan/chitin deacetylase (PgdA/CDA1 family)
VRFLLSGEQPVEQAHSPTLDLHIMMLRHWILSAGVSLVEILPTPAGHPFVACLTHDIDFVGIRNHRFDHSMWGFVHRATVGAVRNWLRRRLSLRRLVETWRAVASLPFVYLGWARDFWNPFEWYLRAENRLPVTYFLIPFKGRAGERVASPNASRRAAAYDIAELSQWTSTLVSHGCELGVHGIDAWHSVDRAREERARIAEVTGEPATGIRMHWLLRDPATFRVLEDAGYGYDSTVGYNETIGYRAGTTQVFRPLGATTLLELPMHIQDGALFYPQRLDLSEAQAWTRCRELIDNAHELGGVLTVLWHDRSHGPERFWGDFYVRLVEALRSSAAWFGTGAQVVAWFRTRRAVRFERVEAADGAVRLSLHHDGEAIAPALTVRVHRSCAEGEDGLSPAGAAPRWIDVAWTGADALVLESASTVEEGVYVS